MRVVGFQEIEGAPTGFHESVVTLPPCCHQPVCTVAVFEENPSVFQIQQQILKVFIKSLMGISCGQGSELPMGWK